MATGRAFVALMHFPLTLIHPGALRLAAAVECSDGQGKAWALHDEIVSAPKTDLVSALSVVGIRPEVLETCVAGAGTTVVNRHLTLGNEIGIRATPTILYGIREGANLRITSGTSGAVPVAVVSKHLDEAVAGSQDHQRR